MKKMSTYIGHILIIISTILIMSATSYGQSDTLRVGYFTFAPHVIANDSGKPSGAACDYLEQYIAPKLSMNIEWVGPLPWLRLYQYAQKGEIDAIVLFAKNPERAENIYYPQHPYTEMTGGLALLKEHPLKEITESQDLYDLTIGYFQGGYIDPLLQDKQIKFENIFVTDWMHNNLEKLIHNRVDAVYNADLVSMRYKSMQLGVIDQVKFVEIPNSTTGLYTAFSQHVSPEIIDKYERVLETLNDTTPYETVLKTYMQSVSSSTSP